MTNIRINFTSDRILLKDMLDRCKTKEKFFELMKTFPINQLRSKKEFKMYQDKAKELGVI